MQANNCLPDKMCNTSQVNQLTNKFHKKPHKNSTLCLIDKFNRMPDRSFLKQQHSHGLAVQLRDPRDGTRPPFCYARSTAPIGDAKNAKRGVQALLFKNAQPESRETLEFYSEKYSIPQNIINRRNEQTTRQRLTAKQVA